MAAHFESVTRENRRDDLMSDIEDMGTHKTTGMWSFSFKALILALTSTILTNTNLVPFLYKSASESFLVAFTNSQHYEFNHIFILIAFYWIFEYAIRCLKHGYKVSILYVLLAIVFAFFMVEGQRYVKQDTIRSFVMGYSTVFMYMAVMVGWAIVFLAALILLDKMFESISTRLSVGYDYTNRIVSHISRHIFVYILLLLLLMLLPVSLIAFPGQFMGDTAGIIAQGYNIESYKPYWSPEEGGIKLGNHHPITYTLLLHVCIVTGKSLFGSYNIGIYINVLLQIIISAAAFAYCISTLHHSGILRLGTALILACCYGLNAQVQTYLLLVSKDAFYGAAILFFLTSAYRLCYCSLRKSTCFIFVCSALLCVLFRNDGIYVILPTLFVLLTQKQSRRISAVLLPALIVFWLVFGKILLPLAGVAPGSKREMLSIPFQQTARYLVTHPEDVTESEQSAIDSVLIYNLVAESYDPDISDPVKNLYREKATGEDVSRYFKAWKSMFVKHPATYVYAFLNNKYEYFYPNAPIEKAFSFGWSEIRMDVSNQYCETVGTDFHYPLQTKTLRELYETIRDSMLTIPLISGLLAAPFYLWISLILLAYSLKRKNRNALVLCVPILMIILINLAGPTNGNYFRYSYPIMICLPIIISSTLHVSKEQQ